VHIEQCSADTYLVVQFSSGPGLQQHHHDGKVALAGCNHEGRLAVHLNNDVRSLAPHCAVQITLCEMSDLLLQIGISLRIDQQARDLDVIVDRRDHQWGDPTLQTTQQPGVKY
jgi:hypothetical protein